MTTKQFTLFFVIIIIVSFVYIYDTTSAIASRSKCADYAMNLVVESFPNSFENTGDLFPPNRLKAEASQDALANYNLFYNFCMDKRGVAR